MLNCRLRTYVRTFIVYYIWRSSNFPQNIYVKPFCLIFNFSAPSPESTAHLEPPPPICSILSTLLFLLSSLLLSRFEILKKSFLFFAAGAAVAEFYFFFFFTSFLTELPRHPHHPVPCPFLLFLVLLCSGSMFRGSGDLREDGRNNRSLRRRSCWLQPKRIAHTAGHQCDPRLHRHLQTILHMQLIHCW